MVVKIQQHALYFKGLSAHEKSMIIDTSTLYHLELTGAAYVPTADYVEVHGKDENLYKLLYSLSFNYDIEIV